MAGMGRAPNRPAVAEDVRPSTATGQARGLKAHGRDNGRGQPGIFSRTSSGLVTSPIALMATRV
jgi:hypothetical protein